VTNENPAVTNENPAVTNEKPAVTNEEPSVTNQVSIGNANKLLRARFMATKNAATAKVALVTLHMWEDFPVWADCTFRQSKAKYCVEHGYALLDESFFIPIMDQALPLRPWMVPPDKTPRYRKLQFLEMILRAQLPFDWLLWMDGDAVFTNPGYTVENRLSNVKSKLRSFWKKPVFVLTNDQTNINNGVWLIRNSPEAHQAVIDIFNEENDVKHDWADQLSFVNFMKHNPEFVRDKMLVLPHRLQWEWQAYDHHRRRPLPWILHLAGYSMEKRKAILKPRGFLCGDV
jgi:hypothetical protein